MYGVMTTCVSWEEGVLNILVIYIYCNWVVTRWQWLFYMYTRHYYYYYYYYYYCCYVYHNVNTVPANIMATQTHSPVPLISKGLMVKELLHVRLATLYIVLNGL